MHTNRKRYLGVWLLLIAGLLISCSPKSTPPGANSIGGAIDRLNYSYHYWDEGLGLLIWHDFSYGAESCSGTGSTEDPIYRLACSVQAQNGRRFEWEVYTSDGVQGDFTIDGIQYDLDQGMLFLIRTAGSVTQVEQLDLDLSGLSPTNAGIEDFGRQTAEIARFMQLSSNGAAKTDCSGAYGEAEPPTETTVPANPLPHSLKGYVLQSYCQDGQWYFTLTVGRNAVYPCERSEPVTTDNVPSYTLKGREALKETLDQLQPGEYVTWCSSELSDADVINDLLAFSQRSGLELSVWTDPKPSPTVTAQAPILADPTPTDGLDSQLRSELRMTTSVMMPDDSLWYAFDKFDDAGGSLPYYQNHGLYRLKDAQITHFDIPATIRVLEVAPDGYLYVGAGCGVMRFRDDSWETLLEIDCNRPTSGTKLHPLDIAFSENGTVWVGGAHSLASYSNNSWTEFDIPAARVVVASDGTIWTRGWDGWANSECCLTHISGTQTITYTYTSDVPVEPTVLNSLLNRPGW